MDKRIQELGGILRHAQESVENAKKSIQTLEKRCTGRSGLNLEEVLQKTETAFNQIEETEKILVGIKEGLRKVNEGI